MNKLILSNEEWLDLYEKHQPDIPDEILDEADEYFGFDDLDADEVDKLIDDDWYIWVVRKFLNQ